MLVVPFACAEFHDKSGNVIHRITADKLRSITEVPEAIRQDPLFAMMVKDGSLKAPENKLDLLALENDPEAKIGKDEVGKAAGRPSGKSARKETGDAAKPAKSETEKPVKAEGTKNSSAAPAEETPSDGTPAGKKA